MANHKNSIGSSRGRSARIRTGNAVADELLAQLARHPGHIVVADNAHVLDQLEGYGISRDVTGVLYSLPSGHLAVLDRETYDRQKELERRILEQQHARHA